MLAGGESFVDSFGPQTSGSPTPLPPSPSSSPGEGSGGGGGLEEGKNAEETKTLSFLFSPRRFESDSSSVIKNFPGRLISCLSSLHHLYESL